MPYKSAKQRRWMHANKPRLAAKWDRKYGKKPARKHASKARKSK